LIADAVVIPAKCIKCKKRKPHQEKQFGVFCCKICAKQFSSFLQCGFVPSEEEGERQWEELREKEWALRYQRYDLADEKINIHRQRRRLEKEQKKLVELRNRVLLETGQSEVLVDEHCGALKESEEVRKETNSTEVNSINEDANGEPVDAGQNLGSGRIIKEDKYSQTEESFCAIYEENLIGKGEGAILQDNTMEDVQDEDTNLDDNNEQVSENAQDEVSLHLNMPNEESNMQQNNEIMVVAQDVDSALEINVQDKVALSFNNNEQFDETREDDGTVKLSEPDKPQQDEKIIQFTQDEVIKTLTNDDMDVEIPNPDVRSTDAVLEPCKPRLDRNLRERKEVAASSVLERKVKVKKNPVHWRCFFRCPQPQGRRQHR